MKPTSLLGVALLALAALAGGDAAKCGVKTLAPVPASTPVPMVTSSKPVPSTKLPNSSRPVKPAVKPSSRPPTSIAPAAADSDTASNSTSMVKQSSGCGKPAAIKTGSYKITVNGKQRDYMVRMPQNYDSNKPYRVVFTFHWRGGSMLDAAKLSGGYYGLEALAKESTIFVSPQGLDAGWANIGGEDIKLVDMIVDTVDRGLCVNQNLRFATGFSYGAAMSHSVACSLPDKFRGISLYSGGQFSGCAGGTKPIAYMVSHGLSDDQVPISNGRQLRDHFVKVNGCTPQNPQEPAVGSGTHVKTEYKGCSAGHPVVYIAFDGPHTATPADRGKPQWAPSETWAFFSQFS